ncbi:MAG: DNA translocase FtsK 4TM domain-containing protein [Acidimicrobiia bacterium]|nr:DNA translocase FtsK 4TM domain-containing protein [Acidimicrobiia bacterium]
MQRAAVEPFRGHGHDVAGVLLVVAGVVAGLGMYGDLAGPLGQGMATGFRGLVGLAGYLVPALLVIVGVLVVRGPKPAEDDSDPVAPMVLRAVVGCALAVVAVTGVLHLTGGQPTWGEPVKAFGAAGGYLGFAVAAPAERLLGVWAAALVLGALGVIGLVVLTDRSLRQAADRTASGMAPIGGLLRRGWQALFSLGGADWDDEAEPTAVDSAADRSGEGDTQVDEPLEVEVPGDHGVDDAADAAALAEPETQVLVPDAVDEPSIPAVADVPVDEDATPEQLEIDLGPQVRASPWKLPPAKVLSRAGRHEVDRAAVEGRGRTLERALAEHGVETRLVGMVVGPTVTRYELELGPGVKVARVTSLHKDIAYAMASPDVRILAPIPGRQAIGVEVPNEDRQIVALGDILASEEAKRATAPLEVAIGRDINGRSVLADLSTMPHVLIAGATGAGKSSCINSIITSILMRSTPDQVRMILIDPKRVELGQYNRLPHLLTQVVTNPKKAANALAWAVKEMERRYDLLAEMGFRDISGYNAAFDRGELVAAEGDDVEYQRLTYIMVVVDELNDLMMVAARDVEESICRIAQMARAVGIHLVIATQRPSVNVITGVIKANVPARLAFAVSSLADSRVILDQPGAERLVGRGDLLLLGPSSSIPQRVQGCWVEEKEVRSVVGHWRRQAPEVEFADDEVQGTEETTAAGLDGGGGGGTPGDDDDLLAQARELVVRSQLGSTSMLQRKLRVGFARAGRLMDLLEQHGVVGPSEGSKARAVLMTPEELDGGPSGGMSAGSGAGTGSSAGASPADGGVDLDDPDEADPAAS